MKKRFRLNYEALPQGTLLRAARAVSRSSLKVIEPAANRVTRPYGRALVRSLAILSLGAAAMLLSGCLSVHVQHEAEQPVVVPENPPPPPPANP
jgi:hypothetical protein